jgi:hypothetical protein
MRPEFDDDQSLIGSAILTVVDFEPAAALLDYRPPALLIPALLLDGEM